jgi:CelD/BcsL family acetyltransferase involved in cellulose biosynthesis
MKAFTVQRWSREQFLGNRAAWQSLLERSGADPLFMSWHWVSTWWRHHEARLAAELCVLAVLGADGQLQGIAPFHLRTVRQQGVRARRLELLGNAWRDDSAVFGEYLDVIAARDTRTGVCAALGEWLGHDPQWDELVLCNLRAGSVAEQLAGSLARCAYVRGVESMTGWSIRLPETFEQFLARLSSNTRRKVANQREKLVAAVCEITAPADRPDALGRLSGFVAQRFGSSADAAELRARFHADLVAAWPDAAGLRLTELRSSGQSISVMLNFRIGGTEYYLQSGFDDAHARGLSPGLLHLGYAIESACRDGVGQFDFLAGRGLHRDYKQDFAADGAPLHSLHVVRKPVLRALFRGADLLRGRTSHKARIGA